MSLFKRLFGGSSELLPEKEAGPRPVFTSEPIPGLDEAFTRIQEIKQNYDREKAAIRKAHNFIKEVLSQYVGKHIKVTAVKPPYRDDDAGYSVIGVLESVHTRPSQISIRLSGTSDGKSAKSTFDPKATYVVTEDTQFYVVTSFVPENLAKIRELDPIVKEWSGRGDAARKAYTRDSRPIHNKARTLIKDLIGEYVVLENVHIDRSNPDSEPVEVVVGRLLAEGCDPNTLIMNSTTHQVYAVATWDGKNVVCSKTPETRIKRVTSLRAEEEAAAAPSSP